MSRPIHDSRLADKLTAIIGSWKFLILQTLVLLVYVVLNLYILSNPFDPFPFIFLNLVLSFQAAYTAPVILMSHNRMAERDRELAQNNFKNTQIILQHIATLEKNLIKEVDEAVEEITENVIEEIKDET